MPAETESEVGTIEGLRADQFELQNPAGDISGGVEQEIGDVSSFTLYLDVAAAVDVTVELSPNGGDDWFEVTESPVKFAAAGQDAVHIEYNADRVRLKGSNTENVKAIVREVV
ncbi:hypothetical protein [Halobellus captivus]|uniref:hypothetical protein n=1 Tax=Halobellus captivus TaxID=2592614 RepID=UPI0011A5F761|nr:hypothetical protein [Halobellus captivus]